MALTYNHSVDHIAAIALPLVECGVNGAMTGGPNTEFSGFKVSLRISGKEAHCTDFLKFSLDKGNLQVVAAQVLGLFFLATDHSNRFDGVRPHSARGPILDGFQNTIIENQSIFSEA